MPTIKFQSTLPVGGATWLDDMDDKDSGISIHAPRGGSDSNLVIVFSLLTDFNPRSPWGERPSSSIFLCLLRNFNPRSPWGERLLVPVLVLLQQRFQSTLPVGGATTSSIVRSS